VTAVTFADGRYRVERLIASGGMASVHLAHDGELDRPVAVKVLADTVAGDPSLRERFVREARLAARLAHPNVVAVFDCGEEEGRPYIVTEYVEGETVGELIGRRGPIPAQEAVELALQACAGLAHAHANGLVHRDVKSHNLLVRRDGTVKVADFGIARALEASRVTEAGTILGTAAYLAPEQAAGDEVTPAADVYSLGAVVYELLTGRTPYRFESLAELAEAQAAEAVTPVRELAPEVPPALEAAVMRALARDPAYRPATAAELGAELAAAAPEPETAPLAAEERATEVLVRSAARSRPPVWPFVGGAAVLLAGVVATLALTGGDDDPPPPAAPRVESIRPGATPEQGARNLADWLREHAEPESR
jgi:serine/threonine protein kinase